MNICDVGGPTLPIRATFCSIAPEGAARVERHAPEHCAPGRLCAWNAVPRTQVAALVHGTGCVLVPDGPAATDPPSRRVPPAHHARCINQKSWALCDAIGCCLLAIAIAIAYCGLPIGYELLATCCCPLTIGHWLLAVGYCGSGPMDCARRCWLLAIGWYRRWLSGCFWCSLRGAKNKKRKEGVTKERAASC